MEEKNYLSEKDKILAKAIRSLELEEQACTHNVFHDLLSCIIEQQIHYRSTKKTFEKLIKESLIEEVTINNFEEFEKTAFSKIKLSTRKFETLNRVVEFFKSKELDWQQMEDEEVKGQLKSIKGVGDWTIDMILIYTLNRKDIFPIDDYHSKQVLAKLYGLDTTSTASVMKKEIKKISEHWSPYRSTAFKYLIAWKAALNKKKP